MYKSNPGPKPRQLNIVLSFQGKEEVSALAASAKGDEAAPWPHVKVIRDNRGCLQIGEKWGHILTRNFLWK